MLRIREKLLLAYVLPATAILATFAWLAHRTMREKLEAELGHRLVAIAQAGAGQLDPTLVEGLQRALAEEGDREVRSSRTYGYLRARLEGLRRATGVQALALFDRDLKNLVEDTGLVPVGERHYPREADRAELGHVLRGESRASVLFRGKDGAFYKSGYAPVRRGDAVVAVLAADGPASFFHELAELRRSLIVAGGALALSFVAISLFVAWRLSRPLGSLVEAARAIGGGDLGREIRPEGKDEVGFLARTMEEMRQRIQARERELQMMLSGIAHEVRNPLGGIELYAGLLREDLAGEPPRLARVQKIERELAHLKSVVNDFLDFTRKTPLERADLPLGPWLAEVVELVAADARARGVETELDVAPDVRVRADAEKLRRALLNLLKNALQAMPDGGRLRLEARARDGRVRLAVRDSGVGMPEDVRREIFTPFFTTREKGSGLGMAFVKRIVEDHGGEVDVESAPGAGTTVTLVLPAGGET